MSKVVNGFKPTRKLNIPYQLTELSLNRKRSFSADSNLHQRSFNWTDNHERTQRKKYLLKF